MRLRFLFVLLFAAPGNGLEAADPASLRAQITDRAIQAHMRFLSDDALEGREAGTRGYDIAARYVASHYEIIGLKPAGDGGSWYQNIRFRTAQNVSGGNSITLETDKNSFKLKE